VQSPIASDVERTLAHASPLTSATNDQLVYVFGGVGGEDGLDISSVLINQLLRRNEATETFTRSVVLSEKKKNGTGKI